MGVQCRPPNQKPSFCTVTALPKVSVTADLAHSLEGQAGGRCPHPHFCPTAQSRVPGAQGTLHPSGPHGTQARSMSLLIPSQPLSSEVAASPLLPFPFLAPGGERAAEDSEGSTHSPGDCLCPPLSGAISGLSGLAAVPLPCPLPGLTPFCPPVRSS